MNNKSYNDAYTWGINAYRNGIPYTDNPLWNNTIEQRKGWYDGWEYAEECDRDYTELDSD